MPLTKTGQEVLGYYKKKYGKQGEDNFYASIKKGIPGSKHWHEPKAKHSKYASSLKG